MRSSAGHRIPAGESEIQRLNPQRKKLILDKTGWSRLEAGTLNLEVDDLIVEQIGNLSPFIQESLDGFVYPEGSRHIPSFRRGYLYYLGIASKADRRSEVLVRRAIVPLERCVELLAPVSLCEMLAVNPDDVVEINIAAAPREASSNLQIAP